MEMMMVCLCRYGTVSIQYTVNGSCPVSSSPNITILATYTQLHIMPTQRLWIYEKSRTHPEKDDVIAGLKQVPWVEVLHVWRFIWPSQSREWEEGG